MSAYQGYSLDELKAAWPDVELALKPRPRAARKPASGPITPAYAKAALEQECAAVSKAPKGTRNDTLNRAAFNLGTLVGAGVLDEQEVADALHAAAQAAEDPLPRGEVDATIQSGIAAGKERPRSGDMTPKNGSRRPRVVPLSTIESAAVEYLVRLLIALRKIHILVGDPNIGKSYLVLAILAALLRGREPHVPGESSDAVQLPPMSALYLTNENDPHDVIRPRFEKLGGDPTRLFVVPMPTLDDDTAPIPLTMSNLDLLEHALDDVHAIGAPPVRVVVFDPIQSYLGAGVDMHRANEVRPVLDRLRAFAAKHNVAVILVAHSPKAAGKAIYRTLGSIDIVGAARSVLHAAEIDGQKVLIQTKAIEASSPSIAYEIDEHGLRFTGYSNYTQHDLDTTRPAKKTAGKKEEAKSVILELLYVAPLDVKRLESAVRSVLDCSTSTLRLAREELKESGILDYRRFSSGKAYWYRLDLAEPDWEALNESRARRQ